MNRFFRDNSKKIMAVMSAFLMIIFFMPSFRNSGSSSDRGEHVVATLYGGTVSITAIQREQARTEWAELSRLIFTPPNADEPKRIVSILDPVDPAAVSQIDTNPLLFLLLTQEARQRGIAVSNDQFQEGIRTVSNMPTEYDSDYDLARQSLYDLLLVRDLIVRVGDAVKDSHPRAQRMVAITQQEVSLDVALIPMSISGPATQPSPQQVQSQYDRFSQDLPGLFSDANPLGFGYRLPNRVQIQYVGFTQDELHNAAINSQAAIEWDTKARRLYRTHTSDFVSTTQPSPAPAWEDLPPETVAKVYDQVYAAAAMELAHKIQDRLTEQWSADWQAYQDAMASGSSTAGSSYQSDDYVRKLASSVGQEFGVRPVLGIINNGWKTAEDLSRLEGIGPAKTPSGAPFVTYATVAGDKFTEAQSLNPSQRLALLQPSQAVYFDPTDASEGFFIFRLTGMDPSHAAPLDEVRSQLIDDIHTQAAWDAAGSAAAKVVSAARISGLTVAVASAVPPLSVSTTDYFNPAVADRDEKIPDLILRPGSARLLAIATIKLLTDSAGDGRHVVASVSLGPDHLFAVIELHNIKPMWLSDTDLVERQSEIAAQDERDAARGLAEYWTTYANAVDRTQYKEEPKEGG